MRTGCNRTENDSETLHFLTKNLKNLEKLSVNDFANLCDIHFPKLYCLAIKKFDIAAVKDNKWEKFIEHNTQIRKSMSKSVDNPLDSLALYCFVKSLKILQLEVLKIGIMFENIEELIDICFIKIIQ